MEDNYVVKLEFEENPNRSFFGVFDGHNGHQASQYLAENLHLHFMNHMRSFNFDALQAPTEDMMKVYVDNIHSALTESFSIVDTLFLQVT